jgi:hypothetical protein
MSVGAMVEELERLGVELRVAGGDLEYEGPEKSITPELLERLKVYKADLMMIYSQSEAVAEEGRAPAEIACMQTAGGSESRRLLAAGWEPKERCGKIIWECPDNGFYVSQEVAMHLLEAGIVSINTKAGQTERGNTTR